MSESNKGKILKQIENDYPVETIKVNEEVFWPVVRSFIFNQLLKGIVLVHQRDHFTFLRKIRNALLNFTFWFRKYDYIIVSNELERKKLGSRYIDKLTEGFIEAKAGEAKILYIEQVRVGHHPDKSKNKVSMDFILILSAIYLRWLQIFNPIKIENKDVIDGVVNKYNFSQNYLKTIQLFLSKAFIFNLILKISKPKAIVITDYGYFWATYASKRLNVKVIEYQHGVIGFAHPYYHPVKKLDSQFSPDYLLVFGDSDLKALSHGNYVHEDNIIPIGNYYLDKLADREPYHEIVELIENYEFSVCVPTDAITHDYIMEFIMKVAPYIKNAIFLVSPRNLAAGLLAHYLPLNVKVIMNFSFQEIVRHTDFHTATNSTCCLEALALGARNILIDVDGLASLYFGKILIDTPTVFIKTREEYIHYFNGLNKMDRKAIRQVNNQVYTPDHNRQLSKFLKTKEI